MATIPGALTSLQKRREIMVVTVASWRTARRQPDRSVHLERIAQPGERAGRKRAQRDCGGN
jgi:hypothetical protein